VDQLHCATSMAATTVEAVAEDPTAWIGGTAKSLCPAALHLHGPFPPEPHCALSFTRPPLSLVQCPPT